MTFDNRPNVTSIPATRTWNAGNNNYDVAKNTGTAKGFIPEIWSDEIIAQYELSIVAANHVKKMSMKGKKGDTMHIPRPARGDASIKVIEESVTLQAPDTDDLPLVVDKHYEYSVHIEDLAETQALSSLRRFYTEDAGYALAKRVDTDLLDLGVGFGDGDPDRDPTLSLSWEHSQSFVADPNGIAPYVGNTGTLAPSITDKSTIIEMVRVLDEQDVPMSGRCMIVHPIVVADLRKIDEFISADYVSGQPTVSGKIGQLYGIDIYVSTNCPVVENLGAGGRNIANFLFHRDAMVLVEQMGIRSQTQYQQEYLATLYTADRLYGCSTYRKNNGIVLTVGR